MKKLFFQLLPKNLASRAFGSLVECKNPFLAPLTRDVFRKIYALDEEEMEFPARSYPTLQALFTRRLKPGARPLAATPLVSPVDGKISQGGDLTGAQLELIQAKGKNYSLASLVGDAGWASQYEGGQWCTIYLAPFNYHRIHAPASGRVSRIRHIPGHLWPVNTWSVENVHELFCVNERVITELELPEGGKILVVKVGATNVGKISLAFDSFKSNLPGQFGVRDWQPAQETFLNKGEELACFELGSTVVLVMDQKARSSAFLQSVLGQTIRVGESLN